VECPIQTHNFYFSTHTLFPFIAQGYFCSDSLFIGPFHRAAEMSSTVTYSPQEIKKVKSIQFSILSPEDIVQMSVAEIIHAEAFEKGKPKIGGTLYHL
jgi:hypothetical protein